MKENARWLHDYHIGGSSPAALSYVYNLDASGSVGMGEFEVAIIVQNAWYFIFETFDVDRSDAIEELEFYEAVQAWR